MEPKTETTTPNPQDYTAEGFERYKQTIKTENAPQHEQPHSQRFSLVRRVFRIIGAFNKGFGEDLPRDLDEYNPTYPPGGIDLAKGLKNKNPKK